MTGKSKEMRRGGEGSRGGEGGDTEAGTQDDVNV